MATAETTGEEGGASSTLLSDYSFTKTGTALRTPRTPAVNRDTILEVSFEWESLIECESVGLNWNLNLRKRRICWRCTMWRRH